MSGGDNGGCMDEDLFESCGEDLIQNFERYADSWVDEGLGEDDWLPFKMWDIRVIRYCDGSRFYGQRNGATRIQAVC